MEWKKLCNKTIDGFSPGTDFNIEDVIQGMIALNRLHKVPDTETVKRYIRERAFKSEDVTITKGKPYHKG